MKESPIHRYQVAINALMWVAVLYVVAWTVAAETDEWFDYGAETGGVGYDFAIAYASAWLFQWLVIIRPSAHARASLNRVIAPRLDRLVELGIELSTVVSAKGNEAPSFPLPSGLLKQAISTTNPSDEAPGWMANWNEVIEELAINSAVHRDGLKPFYASLDHRLIALLEVEEIKMLVMHRTARASTELRWEDMNRFTQPMSEWLEAVEGVRQERITRISPDQPIPTIDPDRFDHQRVPIGRLGEVKKAADELSAFLDDLVAPDESSGSEA